MTPRLAILCIVIAVLRCSIAYPVAAADVAGRASVIDGDTIEIHNQRIRIWGIDAFEAAQLCIRNGKSWRCGQAAANALDAWIGERSVSCIRVDIDRYKRTVARCNVAGTDLGSWLVVNGWALDWPLYSGGFYASYEQRAKDAKVGAWSGVFERPWDWRSQRR